MQIKFLKILFPYLLQNLYQLHRGIKYLKKRKRNDRRIKSLGQRLGVPYPGFTFTEFYEICTRSYKIFFLFSLISSTRISNESCNKLYNWEQFLKILFSLVKLIIEESRVLVKDSESSIRGSHSRNSTKCARVHFLFHKISTIYSPRTTYDVTMKREKF